MFQRRLTQHVAPLRAGYPVLIVTGPRQAGKTTLARSACADLPYCNMEDPVERRAFDEDPRAWFARHPDGAIIDEVQRVPELPSWLQVRVDEDRRLGRWLLTGSQQYMVLDRVTQSLAGRAALLELMPFDHRELCTAGVAPATIEEAIWRGGYPPIHDRPVEPARWLGDYLATYVERDVRQIQAVRDLSLFGAFVKLCATRVGCSLNLSVMAGELGIDAKTARGWLSILEAGYIIHLLPPHFANLGKRVVKHPKLYFIDTGLACHLLGIGGALALADHPLRGALVENWVVAEALRRRRHDGRPVNDLFWWRSHDGLEVDLVIDRGLHLHPIEIKATMTPRPTDAAALQRFRALAGERAGPGSRSGHRPGPASASHRDQSDHDPASR